MYCSTPWTEPHVLRMQHLHLVSLQKKVSQGVTMVKLFFLCEWVPSELSLCKTWQKLNLLLIITVSLPKSSSLTFPGSALIHREKAQIIKILSDPHYFFTWEKNFKIPSRPFFFKFIFLKIPTLPPLAESSQSIQEGWQGEGTWAHTQTAHPHTADKTTAHNLMENANQQLWSTPEHYVIIWKKPLRI